jgi:1-deoxy-D-xylulose-5-phosphate reductoisomerase
MKTVAILGSTGSIGKNALKVIGQLGDRFKIVGLVSGSNASSLAEQINKFRPQLAAIMDEGKFELVKDQVNGPTKILAGQQGVEQVASCAADIVVMAISGSAALVPTLKCLEKSKRLALANKESLVMAGDIIMRRAQEKGAEIIPIDSEHSAIFQCLKSEENRNLEKIYLTCSGGPLKDIAKEELKSIEPGFALAHPRWQMGKKISIDSATLMNKGFEVIEANYLFGLGPERIEILIHPEAIIHSLVQFIDGTILAQLGVADMCLPIQYALTYPERLAMEDSRLDFSQIAKLSFQSPDLNKFACLALALKAAKEKGLAGCVLAVADEECVLAYLDGKIKITDIARIIEEVLAGLNNKVNPSLADTLETEQWAREQVRLRI